MKHKIRSFIMYVLLLVGLGILLYPDYMNWIEIRNHVEFYQAYSNELALLAEAELEAEFQRARDHNATITDIQINDPWGEGANDMSGTTEYYSLLNFGRNNMLGRIEIPVINVDLPIFHGSTSHVLDRGVGHMPHTSLPIGGYGNHAILTAHTGLVHARLFTDLILVTQGDKFIVEVAGKRLAYEIDQIDIVLPHEIDILETDPNEDWITLVTCTPYAINSHRLLVRGMRVPYVPGMTDEIEAIVDPWHMRHLAVAAIIALMILIAIARGIKQLKRRKKKSINDDNRFEREYDEVFGKKAQVTKKAASVI